MFSLPPKILANWCSPVPWWLALWEAWSCSISAFRRLSGELKDEVRAREARVDKRIDEVKEEMKEFKQEMSQTKTLLIQVLHLPPPAQP